MITYQTLFDQFPLPAFLLGPLGEVVLANPSAASLLGLPARPEQLDQPWTLHVGERWVSLVEQIRDALEGRRASFDLLDPRTPDTGVRIPLLCRPLPDDQGGRLLLCTAASEVSPSRAWSSAEEQLHRIRIGEDARRTLQNILVVVRNGLDLDRVLFIERDHPRPGLAAISQESCRAGLEPLADGFPPLGNELYPRQWTPLLQPLAYADLAAINLPRGLQGLVERLSARSLIAVEVRPVEGPSGFLVGLQVASPHPWSNEETRLFGRLGWAASLALEASAQLGRGQERLRWYEELIDTVRNLPRELREEVESGVAQELLRLTGARQIYLMRTAPDGPEIVAQAGYGTLSGEQGAQLLCQAASNLALEQQHAIPWSTSLPHPLSLDGPEGTAYRLSSVLFLPCSRRGQVGPIPGFVCCLGESDLLFDEQQLAALGLLCERLAPLLDEEPEPTAPGGETILPAGVSVAGLTHDLNNILGIITSYASSVESDLAPDDPLREDLRVVLDAVDQGSKLVRQLGRAADSEPPPAPPLDVVRTLRQVRDMLQRLLPGTFQVELLVPGDLPLVRIGEADLKQAILGFSLGLEELLPQGGVLRLEGRTVVLGEQQARQLHPAARPESHLVLLVAGAGPGCTAEALGRLLQEPAAGRAGVAASSRRALGLVLARDIVRDLGGFCVVEGQGIGLYLPLTGREELRIPSEELPIMGLQPIDQEQQAPTILLIDDEPHLRNSGERNLTRYGYQVLTAPDGELGVHLYRRFLGRIDLVILDLIMPGMDGRNTFRALKAIDPAVTVLIASGFATDATLEELKQEGAAGFIAKPFTAKEINRTVRSVLRAR